MKLIDYRKSNKMTQGQMANGINVSRPMYTRYERGDLKPTMEVAVRIAAFTKGAVPFAEFYPELAEQIANRLSA